MKAMLLVLVVAVSVGIVTAQTDSLVPCAKIYFDAVCEAGDENRLDDWISDQLDDLIDCNGAQTAALAADLASTCARDVDIGINCGVAKYYVADVLEILSVCAEPIANESVDCSAECTSRLQTIRGELGCCINNVFNVTAGPVYAAFENSLWSSCNVAPITTTCEGTVLDYTIPNSVSQECTSSIQSNRSAARFCTAGEKTRRSDAFAATTTDCTNFDTITDNYCAQDQNNRYCLTRDQLADNTNYLDPIKTNCPRADDNQICSAECKQYLTAFEEDLGCCLNVVYNTTYRIVGLDTFPLEDDRLFRLCELDTPKLTCGSQALVAYGFTLILLLFVSMLG